MSSVMNSDTVTNFDVQETLNTHSAEVIYALFICWFSTLPSTFNSVQLAINESPIRADDYQCCTQATRQTLPY